MKKQNKNAPLTETKKGLVLSPKHQAAIEQIENVNTVMEATGQQLVLAVEDILVREFHFTEDQIRHLEVNLREMLATLANVEREQLVVLSPHDMKAVGVLAALKLKKKESEKKLLIGKN